MAAGKHQIILETVVGSYAGKAKRRPELGETVVAWAAEGSDKWQLVSPTKTVAYTDASWVVYESNQRKMLEEFGIRCTVESVTPKGSTAATRWWRWPLASCSSRTRHSA